MNSEYKLIRENFIRGHNGSTPQEVIVLTAIVPLSNLLLVTVLSLFTFLTKKEYKWSRMAIEFMIIFIPFVLSVTTLSDHINHVFIIITSLIIVNILLCVATKPNAKPINVKEMLDLDVNYGNRVPFASNLMSSLLLSVCVAILAVDFPVFSRRFSKTELYGWSLMDVGVGAFIAINGGLSPESRLGTDRGYAPMFLFKKTLLSTVPLLVLGFQRLAAVKALNYHEHITEYGLHWNFFFTLAFTKLFSTTFCCLFSSKVNIGLTSICLLIFHQISLTFFGLSDYIRNEDRDGLISSNKEGIISLVGYISLYLFFVEVGRYLLNRNNDMRFWLKTAMNTWGIAIISYVFMIVSHVYVEEVSRREANFGFVCWMIAFICSLLGLELFIQAIIQICQHLNYFPSGDTFKSALFSSIGYSGMLVFLIANVFTGLVNFLCDTIATSNFSALLIIILYCAAISVFAIVCAEKNIQLKFPMKQKSS